MVNDGMAAFKLDGAKITCAKTFFGHTHLTVVSHIKSVDRTAFTGSLDHLHNVLVLLAGHG